MYQDKEQFQQRRYGTTILTSMDALLNWLTQVTKYSKKSHPEMVHVYEAGVDLDNAGSLDQVNEVEKANSRGIGLLFDDQYEGNGFKSDAMGVLKREDEAFDVGETTDFVDDDIYAKNIQFMVINVQKDQDDIVPDIGNGK